MNANAHPEPPERDQQKPAKITRRRIVAGIKTLLVYLLIFILASFVGNLWMTREHNQGPATAISGQNIDAHWAHIDFKQPPGPVLLYFFAEWCPICRVQNPVITSVADDVRVVGIAMQSGELDKVREYSTQHHLNFEIINDPQGRISELYGVQGVPAVFVIDNQQRIRYSTMGYATALGLRIRLWLSR